MVTDFQKIYSMAPMKIYVGQAALKWTESVLNVVWVKWDLD